MAVEVKIDRIDLLEAQERNGVTIRLVRRARVINLTNTDHTVLFSALAEAGIPAAGSTLTGVGASNLILTERNPRIVDKTTVDVDLVYEKFDNEGQSFDTPPLGFFTANVRVSVQQVTTNKDIDGLAVSVEHTWPSVTPPELQVHPAGELSVQGGEFQAFIPQRSFSVEGYKITNAPWVLANQMIGRLNNAPFSGQAIHEWMCVGATWRIADNDIAANRYFMSFEFQHNPDTWNPTVVFIDPETGKPPKDLVQGVGFKTIRRNPEINFETVLGTRIQGA